MVFVYSSGSNPIPSSTAISLAVEANSSNLRKVIDKSQLLELIPELFGSHIIQFEEYEFLEELRLGSSPRNETVEKVASAIGKSIKSNPSQLRVFINLSRKFGLLHGIARRIKAQYGKL